MAGLTFRLNDDVEGQVYAMLDYTGFDGFEPGVDNQLWFCPLGEYGSGCHSDGPGVFIWGDPEGGVPADWFAPGTPVGVFVQDLEGSHVQQMTGVWPNPDGTPFEAADVPISDWSNVIQLTAGTAPTLPPVLNLTGVIEAPNWHLSWDKFEGATSYEVQIKHEPSGAWADVATVAATADARQNYLLDFTGETYVEFDPYSFRVRALGPA